MGEAEGLGRVADGAGSSSGAGHGSGPGDDSHAVSEVKQLRAQLQQRDNEIAILVGMVQQGGGPGPAGAGPKAAVAPRSAASPGAGATGGPAAPGGGSYSHPGAGSGGPAVPGPGTGTGFGGPRSPRRPGDGGAGSVGSMLAAGEVDPAVLVDRDKAMDVFMASYPRAQVRSCEHPGPTWSHAPLLHNVVKAPWASRVLHALVWLVHPVWLCDTDHHRVPWCTGG